MGAFFDISKYPYMVSVKKRPYPSSPSLGAFFDVWQCPNIVITHHSDVDSEDNDSNSEDIDGVVNSLLQHS